MKFCKQNGGLQNITSKIFIWTYKHNKIAPIYTKQKISVEEVKRLVNKETGRLDDLIYQKEHKLVTKDDASIKCTKHKNVKLFLVFCCNS
jgi:hypothetical protein